MNEMPPSKHKCRFYKEKPWEINWLQKAKFQEKQHVQCKKNWKKTDKF